MLQAARQLFIAFLIGLTICPPHMALASGITPDVAAPPANQATMDVAPNGVTVVNIAASRSGMSHNKFSQFNVGPDGVIFNNSVAPGVSQLGGAMAHNPNLGGQAASTILNEVTGTGRSSIQGYMEVFGQSANLILANPNGISINGGGFINTPKATLTTGVPQFDGTDFLGLDVRGGDVLVEGAGVNANNIDAFEIVTRAAQINADIYANQLSVVTGQNRHNPVDGTTSALTPDGSVAPVVSIDSSALGGMYAGRITLVGTEAGVGVNTQGIVQATEHLEMTADGKIQIKGKAASAQTLAVTSKSDEVAVSGVVRANDVAVVAGQTVTVVKDAADDAALVSADTVRINAGTLDNQHDIVGDSETVVDAVNVHNTGQIGSGGSALFRIDDTLHNDQGTILSIGDMIFEGAADGEKMAALQNDSGLIESLEGGLTFRAVDFQNNNSHFALVEGAEFVSVNQGAKRSASNQGWHERKLFSHYIGSGGYSHNVMFIYPEQRAAIGLSEDQNVYTAQEVREAIARTDAAIALDPNYLSATGKTHLNNIRAQTNNPAYLYYGRTVGRTNGFAYSATVTRDTASGQELGATMAAQGDILIEAGDAKNTVSAITSATGDIVINADAFENVGKEIYERTTYKYGRAIFHSHQSPKFIPTGGGTEVHLKPIDYAYGTIDAGGRVVISAGSVSNGVTERNGVHAPRDVSDQRRMVADVAAVVENLVRLQLFQPGADKDPDYDVEDKFIDLDEFYGSDYALERMGVDPNEVAEERLDPFVETQMVRAQILDLRGRRFLDNAITTDAGQFKALMDNAVQAGGDLGLGVGVSLTEDQVAALTDDIVWFESREVGGQRLLVPVVYLGSNSLDKIAQGGSVIAGAEVEINTTGDVANAGLIQSDGQTSITAENFFNNKGTVSGQNVAVTAMDSIRNTGGTIEGGDVALKAGNDVVIASSTVQFSGENTAFSAIAKTGKVTAEGDLSIEAGRDVGILGAEIQAGGDAVVKAGRNVAVSTVETTYNSENRGSGYNNHTNIVTNKKSTVTTGGALTMEAGQDMAVHGSEIAAGGDVDIAAGGDVAITTAKDSTEFYSHNSGGGGGFFGGKKTTTIDQKNETAVVSVVKSGANMSVEAGAKDLKEDEDADEVGSVIAQGELEAAEDMAIKASGDINITTAQVQNYAKHESTSSGFMGAKSMELTESDTLANVRPLLKAGQKLVVDAQGDVVIQSADIESGDVTEITSREGQVSMLVSKDSEYKRSVKTDMGFFSWKTTDEGSRDETVQHTEIEAAGGLTITTAEGVVVQYRETGNVKDDIAQLAQSPGLEWMGELAARDDVDWVAVQEVHNQWKESDSGVGGPGMQLVSLAMAVALSATGWGTAFAGSFELGSAAMTAALEAGFNALVMQAGMQVVGNGGDIGAALEALASIETVQALATAMLTAGLSKGALDAFDKTEFAGTLDGLAKDLANNTIKAGVRTGVGTAVNGGDLGENLVANLHSAAVSTLGADLAQEIGAAYDDGDLDYVSHKIAHAALGGAMDLAMGGDGVSGAIGGTVGEITGEVLADQIQEAMLTGDIDPKAAKNWLDASVDMSKLMAGFAAAALGKGIDAAADAGGNAAENNAALALRGFIALEKTAPHVFAAALALYASGEGSLKEFNKLLREGAAELKAWVVETYQGLTEEQKQQLDIPGYDVTEIDIALGGTPSETNHDQSPIITPDGSGIADSGTVSEDQKGQVDDTGAINYTPEQLEVAGLNGLTPDWVKTDGTIRYPPHSGFESGRFRETTIQPGTLIDRYGGEGGRFLSPAGTPFGERALPPAKEGERLRVYEVVKPLPVKAGNTAAWFDQPGGGTQYETKISVQELKDGGYIREVK